MFSSTPMNTTTTAHRPDINRPAQPAATQSPGRIMSHQAPEYTSSPRRSQKELASHSTWLLQSRTNLDNAFEKAWAAYAAVYNKEFKTRTSMEEVREQVMSGHIHGEDVLLPRPAVEYRLTRRRKLNNGNYAGID